MPLLARALALTQEELAAHYHIPLGILRDWEQGRFTITWNYTHERMLLAPNSHLQDI